MHTSGSHGVYECTNMLSFESIYLSMCCMDSFWCGEPSDVGAGIQACVLHNAWALSPTWGLPILSEDQVLATGLLLSSHKDILRAECCAIHVKLYHQGGRGLKVWSHLVCMTLGLKIPHQPTQQNIQNSPPTETKQKSYATKPLRPQYIKLYI